MQPDRESPNPFESPQTVASGEDDTHIQKERGPALTDIRHQTIGFLALTGVSILAIVVAFGAFWIANRLTLAPRWDWTDTALRAFGFLLLVPSGPGFIVCALWTLVSAAKWAMLARTGFVPESKLRP